MGDHKQVHALRQAMVSTGLLDLLVRSTDQQIEEYARKTNVKPEWVKQRLRAGRKVSVDLCGFPGEVRGQPWGIIVVDSKASVIDSSKVDGFYKQFAKILGKLLERA